MIVTRVAASAVVGRVSPRVTQWARCVFLQKLVPYNSVIRYTQFTRVTTARRFSNVAIKTDRILLLLQYYNSVQHGAASRAVSHGKGKIVRYKNTLDLPETHGAAYTPELAQKPLCVRVSQRNCLGLTVYIMTLNEKLTDGKSYPPVYEK